MRRLPPHRVALVLLIVAIALFVALIVAGNSVFDDYSRDFGHLTPDQFAAANSTMDRLRAWSRGVLFFGVAPLDLATLVLAIRAKKTALAIIVGLGGLALAVLLALAASVPSASMVG